MSTLYVLVHFHEAAVHESEVVEHGVRVAMLFFLDRCEHEEFVCDLLSKVCRGFFGIVGTPRYVVTLLQNVYLSRQIEKSFRLLEKAVDQGLQCVHLSIDQLHEDVLAPKGILMFKRCANISHALFALGVLTFHVVLALAATSVMLRIFLMMRSV